MTRHANTTTCRAGDKCSCTSEEKGLVTGLRLINNGLSPTPLTDILHTLEGLACSLEALQLMRDEVYGAWT